MAADDKRDPAQPLPEPGKYPIDRPCSACSAGDTEMKHHDHEPPFRKGYGSSVPASSISARDNLLKEYEASGETGSLSFCGWLVKQVMETRASSLPQEELASAVRNDLASQQVAHTIAAEKAERIFKSKRTMPRQGEFSDSDVWREISIELIAGSIPQTKAEVPASRPSERDREDSAKAQAWQGEHIKRELRRRIVLYREEIAKRQGATYHTLEWKVMIEFMAQLTEAEDLLRWVSSPQPEAGKEKA